MPKVVVAHSCVNSWAEACGETNAFTGEEWNVYSGASGQVCEMRMSGWHRTRAFRDQLVSLYGLNQGGIVIWNGVDIPQIPRAGKQPVVLGGGPRMGQGQEPVRTLARPQLPQTGRSGLQALPGPTGRRCERNCELLGEISHRALLHEMDSASIFVSPALYEPFGLSVLEAASAGCALMLSDIATFRELWDGAALFFDPRDRDGLVSRLRSLCRDDLERVRLQRAAAKRAQHYRLHTAVSDYRALYASLLAGVAGRATGAHCGEMLA